MAMEETSRRTEERIAFLDIAAALEKTLPQIMLEALVFWLRQKSNTSPSNLFTHLNLGRHNKDVSQILDNQALFQWVFIVDSSYLKSYEEASRVMLETLSSHYKDKNNALVEALVARLNIADGSAAIKFAERMLQEQIKSWAGEETDKTSEVVFTLLNFCKVEGELFHSPAFPLWFAFLRLRYPDKGPAIWAKPFHRVMFRTLSLHYKDDNALFEVLSARFARPKNEDDRHLAWRLLHEQMRSWGKTGKKSPDDGFTRLNVDIELFDSPAFHLWVYFVSFRHKPLSAKSSWEMFNTLSRRYIGGTEALITDLISRVELESYEGEFAFYLLRVQIKSWDITVEEAFKRLNLDIDEEELPPFWARYSFELWDIFITSRMLTKEKKLSQKIKTMVKYYKNLPTIKYYKNLPTIKSEQNVAAKPSD